MPTSAEGALPSRGTDWCADTSVAVAALDASHEAHESCRTAAKRRRPALAGHAAFETYSVLTRLPGRARVPGDVAWAAIDRAFPELCWLNRAQHERLIGRLAPLGIEGGMVYDALVGEASRVAGRRVLTRGGRAVRVYALLGVDYELVD